MRPLDTGLEKLADLLVRMGETAIEIVTLSIDGFLRKRDVGEQVHAGSQSLATMSWDIEDKAFELVARYQPVASDLRIINSYVLIKGAGEPGYAGKEVDIAEFLGLDRCPECLEKIPDSRLMKKHLVEKHGWSEQSATATIILNL